MGRVQDLLEDFYDGEITPEECAAAAEARAERLKEEVRQAEERRSRECRWAAEHPQEWAEWRKARAEVEAGDIWGPAFGLEGFMAEVARAPCSRHAVGPRDSPLGLQRGNLVWRCLPPRIDTPYLTADEAAAYCRRAKKTLLNHLCQGNVKAVPNTRPPLFLRAALDAWLASPTRARKR